MTVTVFGYLILISIDFYDFILRFLLSFSFDWEDISDTEDSVQPHFQPLVVYQEQSTARRIFTSLLDVWKCGEARSFVFDILLLTYLAIQSLTSKAIQLGRSFSESVKEVSSANGQANK